MVYFADQFLRIQLNIIHTFSLVVAVLAVLRFYMNLKTELKGHKPLAKLFAFKLLVGLTFLLKVRIKSSIMLFYQKSNTDKDHLLDS